MGTIVESSSAPIGVFDSGVGGISVLRALCKEMPEENYIYYGDSLHSPYGTKSLEEVQRLSIANTEFLLKRGAKAIVVACNTATSAAIRMLRTKYEGIPFVGIEPALKPAVLDKPGSRVIVMATPMTIRERKFHTLLESYEDMGEIISMPCPGLMEYIEQGDLESEDLERFLEEMLAPYMQERIDAVVLGCTHYPFVAKELQKILGQGVKLFEGGPGTAREVKRRVAEKGLLTSSLEPGSVQFENSDPSPEKTALCMRLLKM